MCQEAQAKVEITSGGAVIDGGVNSVLISEETAEHKGLLDKVNKMTKVTLSQAKKAKKMETYSVAQGSISYKMMSKHS